MATRSTISLKTEDGYNTIYCHWDGYPSHNGKLLQEHYNTQERVEELIALGSISSLRKHIKPAEGTPHTFEKPAEDVTVAYHRDRQEGYESVIARHKELRAVYDEGEQYNYVFVDGTWCLIKNDNPGLVLCSDLYN